jgi:hypothetical protein
MTAPRAGHTAVLLGDGRVLLVGGTPSPSAEIYDPAPGAFTALSGLASKPYSWLETAALLHDGRVFIAGRPAAQIFDPATGKFQLTAPYAGAMPEYVERVTTLVDGRVFLMGSLNELYDPQTGTFSVVSGMKHIDDTYTATLLMNGSLLFAGNDENDGSPADVEVFDPASSTFRDIGPGLFGLDYGAATMLPDGSVLMTGNQVPGGNGQNVSEIYSPASGTFANSGTMVMWRHEHTATLLNDGTVLLAGGYAGWPSPDADAELYRPAILIQAPLLFSLSGDGKGQAAIWHSLTGQIAAPGTPAVAGEALSLYTTSLFDGGVIPPQVFIGGRAAEVLYFGAAPGLPGYDQVNVRVPDGVSPGPAVPVRLSYLGRSSNQATIAVQ